MTEGFEPYVESDWEKESRESWGEHVEHRAQVEREQREHRTDWKPAKRIKRKNAPKPDESWQESVFERDGYSCPVHDDPVKCEWPHRAHHVVLAQKLRKDGHADALWARAAGMTVCHGAHTDHHDGIRRIFRDEVPAECVEFLTGLGYAAWFERHYPLRHSDDGDVTQAAA